MTDTTAAPATATSQGYGSSRYRAYVLFGLIVVYTFNFIDRTLISVLGEPIRETFGLSDTMMGLLSGLAFAFLYTILGIPFAMIAERKNRTTIIALAMAVWSGMTVFCGMAQNTFQFALGRVGVGIGEAGCSPPSHSLISDYFPPDKRATALSIYSLGIPIGSMMAAIGGAWIASQQGLDWRSAFIFLGLPGVIFALIFKLTIKEPPRGFSDPGGPVSEAVKPSPFDVFGIVARKPAFWHISLGGALASFVGYGVGQFSAPFWMRVHGLSLMDAAFLYGLVLGIAAAIGTFGGGFLADRLRAKHPNGLSWIPAVGFLIAIPLYIIGYNTLSFFSGNMAIYVAAPLLFVAAACHYMYLGPMFAVTQSLVAPRMRATAAALLLFVVNMIGYAGGPPVIGWISDTSAKWQLEQLDAPITLGQCGKLEARVNAALKGREDAISGDELLEAQATKAEYCNPARRTGVRVAVTLGVLIFLWAAFHYLMVGRTLQRDMWNPSREESLT